MDFKSVNLIHPSDSTADNEFLQLASSLKYSSEHGCKVAELRPGLFALYSYDARVIYVGEDWNEVLEQFRARPKWVNKPYVPKEQRKTEIDLSELRITI